MKLSVPSRLGYSEALINSKSSRLWFKVVLRAGTNVDSDRANEALYLARPVPCKAFRESSHEYGHDETNKFPGFSEG